MTQKQTIVVGVIVIVVILGVVSLFVGGGDVQAPGGDTEEVVEMPVDVEETMLLDTEEGAAESSESAVSAEVVYTDAGFFLTVFINYQSGRDGGV